VIFRATGLGGGWLLKPERMSDERGYFARTFCRQEFEEHGLETEYPQEATSYNHQKGTLRGLHWQIDPHTEAKLVRCPRGALFDVIVDLRDGSPTRGEWFSTELTADNGHQLYIPRGFAHGFQTLCDSTEIHYHLSALHAPASARGIRWDDPTLAIAWPLPVSVLSARDRDMPAFRVEGGRDG